MNNLTEMNRIISLGLRGQVYEAYPPNKDTGFSGLHVEFPKEIKLGLYRQYPLECLKFHQSWDWIIPAVDSVKIIFANEILNGDPTKYNEIIHDMYKNLRHTQLSTLHNSIYNFFNIWLNS